jgi:ABC-type multidrug transport system fused ATPase/permease subunit
MSVGDFTLFVSAIGKITEYIVKVIDNINQFIENANASIDYKRYLEVKEEDKRGIIIDKIETVEFRNVTFIYPKNISLFFHGK